MVDAAASLQAAPGSGQSLATSRAGLTDDIAATVTNNLEAYLGVARQGVFAPAQSPLWIETWIKHADPDHFVATLSRAGQPVLSLALEVTRQGPFRVAGFMGGSHANGNLAPVTASFAESVSATDIQALIAAIGKARPDVDMLRLERLTSEIAGVRNPLLLLPHRQSPNLALGANLAGGFDALLGRASGKRKRKKHRAQMRKFESAGGFRRSVARTKTEVDNFLDSFFPMKELRFRKLGVHNVFGDAQVQSFFRSLFTAALAEPKPPFMLHALTVGDKVRAVTGSSRCTDRLICEFGGITEDDVAFASPGEFLSYDNIREACDEGFAIYDFSVGDEPYKRLWCDMEIRQFDVLVPLTAKGRALAAAMHTTNRLKAFVKNNRLVWKLVKTFRKKAASAQAEPADD